MKKESVWKELLAKDRQAGRAEPPTSAALGGGAPRLLSEPQVSERTRWYVISLRPCRRRCGQVALCLLRQDDDTRDPFLSPITPALPGFGSRPVSYSPRLLPVFLLFPGS